MRSNDDLLNTLLHGVDRSVPSPAEEEQHSGAFERERVPPTDQQRRRDEEQRRRLIEERQRRIDEQQRQVDERQQRLAEELRQSQRDTQPAPRTAQSPRRPPSMPAEEAPEERVYRPLRPKRSQRRAGDAIRRGYEFGALLLAEFAAFSIWLGFWLANGFFTALFVQAVAVQLGVGLNRFIAETLATNFQLTISPVSAWGIGFTVHLIITLIQLHLWRSGRRSTYPLVIVVGAFDVYTSARGIQGLAAAWDFPATGLGWLLIYVILAEAIAIFPERRIVDHATAIWMMLTSRSGPATGR